MSCTSNIVWLSAPLHGRLPPFSQQPTVHGSHYPCAWTRSEHPDLGPIIPTLLSRNIFVGIGIIDPIHSRFVPDGLPTETTCRSFSHFVGPICGLADLVEEWPYNGHDVVVNKGASHDTAGWEHSSCLSLRSFRSKAAAPSLYNFVLTAPCCPLTRTSTVRSSHLYVPRVAQPSLCPLSCMNSHAAHRPRHERRPARRAAPTFSPRAF
ncbi:hypothetical protein EDB89DRAFT_1993241 [Lactarius sanguifluus]|nr:hypothetical protein EDB89DRAFT_1993241 [Lactarius sanguifluus]